MFNKIVNPLTNKKVDINSKLGINIIRNYIKLYIKYKLGGSEAEEPIRPPSESSSENSRNVEYINLDNFEEDHEDNYDEALETARIRMEEAEKMATEKIKLPPIRLSSMSPVSTMSQLSNTGSASPLTRLSTMESLSANNHLNSQVSTLVSHSTNRSSLEPIGRQINQPNLTEPSDKITTILESSTPNHGGNKIAALHLDHKN